MKGCWPPPAHNQHLAAAWFCAPCCSGLLIVGCFSMFCVLIGLIGSLRIACCLSVYLVLGGALTLGANAHGWAYTASCQLASCA